MKEVGLIIGKRTSMIDIEYIIDHIEKQGCSVRVETGRLVLWKEAKGSIVQQSWYISKIDLTYACLEPLLAEANHKIEEINICIATTDPPVEIKA